jgi:hypothetical protein
MGHPITPTKPLGDGPCCVGRARDSDLRQLAFLIKHRKRAYIRHGITQSVASRDIRGLRVETG